jgi:hypothetical protein
MHLGCNFDTMRPLRDILAIYKAVLGPVFGPTAYAGRLLRLAVMLDRSDRRAANCRMATCARGLAASIAYHDYACPAGGLRAILEDLHC